MQRYCLYIDHQLISPLVRQLQNIVNICCQQLDNEYQTYELRTSIYEQFVFQISSLYYTRYPGKIQQNGGVKFKDQEMKKLYELTQKLEGIKKQVKFEDYYYQIGYDNKKKGRPSKNQQAQKKLVQWIKQKIKNYGELKFKKKQIDEQYNKFLSNQDKKKNVPIGTYLRILKNYQMKEVSILTKAGKEKTIKDLADKKDIQKIQEEDLLIKDEFIQYPSQLNETSQFQSHNSYSSNNHYHNNDYFNSPQKKKVMSQRVLRPRNQMNKKIKQNHYNGEVFDMDSSVYGNDSVTPWEKIMEYSDEKIEKEHDIYENSKSFE